MEPSRLVLLQCFSSSPALSAAAEALAASLGPALGLPTQVAEQPLKLPASAHYPARGQWLACALTAALEASAAPPRALLLGLTDVDLFDTGLNFVFGEALRGRGAVVSTARLDEAFYGLEPAPPALRQRRLLTEAVHELGHAAGLAHCGCVDCAMWFSNTLAESDAKGPQLCPDCSEAFRATLSSMEGCSRDRLLLNSQEG